MEAIEAVVTMVVIAWVGVAIVVAICVFMMFWIAWTFFRGLRT